ncbi:uncharacterized protein LOC118495173 [Sander lucioperca]|uniref:uncharacterized protein LOC118495173 n=1 Tax=Sander lucioperca TaxID=283035 RepID=UPI0016535AE8|nr:uncharacterized protein LOC118495173 [Sander lucioperca]
MCFLHLFSGLGEDLQPCTPGSHVGCVRYRAIRSLYNWSESRVHILSRKSNTLLFADYVVLVTSSDCDLLHALRWFVVECGEVRVRVSTSESEAVVFCQKMVDCFLWVGSELLPQVKEFSGCCSQVRVRWAGGLMQSRKAKLSIYQLVYVSTLTYGHELWIVTERTRSQIKAATIRIKSSDIWREIGLEPLLLRVERGQLRWFRHLIRMPPRGPNLQGFQLHPTDRRPQGRPRAHWRDYLRLGNISGSLRRSWKKYLGRGMSGLPCLACCHCNPPPDKWQKTHNSNFIRLVVFFYEERSETHTHTPGYPKDNLSLHILHSSSMKAQPFYLKHHISACLIIFIH